MNVPDSRSDCDPQPPQVRRIHLADGRYMIFYEFGGSEAESKEIADEAEPSNADNV